MQLPSLIWLPQEEACATELVTETLHRALVGTVQEALVWGTAKLGFDSFVFGIAANDRRPDAESRAYILTNQADNGSASMTSTPTWKSIHASTWQESPAMPFGRPGTST